MARLPVYNTTANIQASGGVNIPRNDYISNAIGNLAQQGQELALKWQETQNESEWLDGKNKATEEIGKIFTEAENYNDYKTPKDIETKQKELEGRLNNVVNNVASGFTNQANANRFSQAYQLTTLENSEKLKEIFRKKFIDNNNANLLKSEDMNKNAFIQSGSQSYKDSFFADLERSFKAGYISKEQMTALKLKTDDWDKYMVLRQAETDPEAVIDNLQKGKYNIKPEDMNDLLKDLNAVKTNKKLLQNYQELVKQDVGETQATEFIYSDASYDEKLKYINEKEFTGEIGSSFAQKARRTIKKFKPAGEKTISSAQSMADVLQRVYDLNESAVDSTEYLKGMRSIRETIIEMHSLGDITTKDVVSLNNQIATATRARLAEATSDIGYEFGDAKKYFDTTLPPELRNEAIRDMFYATQEMNLEGKSKKELKKIYQELSIQVSENIMKRNRIGVEKAYQDAVLNNNNTLIEGLATKKGITVDELNKQIDLTAKNRGLTREQVINKLRGAIK